VFSRILCFTEVQTPKLSVIDGLRMTAYKMKYPAVLFLILATLWLTSCDTTGGEDPPPEPEKPGLVAFGAYFSDTDTYRVLVAPFDEPTNYRFIDDLEGLDPHFSPDKSNLLFLSLSPGGIINVVALYDFEQDTTVQLTDVEEFDSLLRAVGKSITWNTEGTGFYYALNMGMGLIHNTYYHQIGDSSIVPIHETALPIERIDRDTLIVENLDEDNNIAYYFMDLRTGTSTRMNNPHLEHELSIGPATLAWNEVRRQLAAVVFDASTGKRQIILTNLDGSFYREVTTGELGNADSYPRWGPNSSVLFLRTESDRSPARKVIMTVDVETGEVREWLGPEEIGATRLIYVDY